MATYNGSRFITEQLKSIYDQSVRPDEVIICDDASSDDTVSKIKEFMDRFSPIGWQLIVNKENLGWKKNFRDLFEKASGSIIYPADQDDIWSADKIEKTQEAMNADAGIMVLASNYEPLYMSDKSPKLNNYYTDRYGETRIERVIMDRLWLETRRSAAAMCFRREVLKEFFEVWTPECAHDRLLQGIALANDGFYILNEILLSHRIHDANNTPLNSHDRNTRINLLNEYISESDRIINYSNGNEPPPEYMVFMRRMNVFWKKRVSAIQSKNLFKLLGLLGSLKLYPKYSSWGADIISSYKGK